MSKNVKKGGQPPTPSNAPDWMAVLRLDKKKFEILVKKVKMPFDKHSPIPDPAQRLSITLRYLATGEGYHESLVTLFETTFDYIFKALMDLHQVIIYAGTPDLVTIRLPILSGQPAKPSGMRSLMAFTPSGASRIAWER